MNTNHNPQQLNRVQLEELLSAYIDGEVTESERQRVEAELATSTDLRADLELIQQTVSMLSKLPRVTAPRPFTLSEADVGCTPDGNSFWNKFPIWLMGWGSAVASLLVMLCIGSMLVFAPTGGAPKELAAVPNTKLQESTMPKEEPSKEEPPKEEPSKPKEEPSKEEVPEVSQEERAKEEPAEEAVVEELMESDTYAEEPAEVEIIEESESFDEASAEAEMATEETMTDDETLPELENLSRFAEQKEESSDKEAHDEDGVGMAVPVPKDEVTDDQTTTLADLGDSDESDSDESDSTEGDSNESDSNESDSNESDSNENDSNDLNEDDSNVGDSTADEVADMAENQLDAEPVPPAESPAKKPTKNLVEPTMTTLAQAIVTPPTITERTDGGSFNPFFDWRWLVGLGLLIILSIGLVVVIKNQRDS